MKVRLLLLSALLATSPAFGQESTEPGAAPEATMTVEKLAAIISELGSNVQQRANIWLFEFYGVKVSCMVSTEFDRMRFIAPIIPVAQLTGKQKDEMLAANIHTALDVRYGIDNGVVYSAFIHPLSPLTEDQVVSAMQQVSRAVLTFGSSYSSTDLAFGAPQPPSQEKKDDEQPELEI